MTHVLMYNTKNCTKFYTSIANHICRSCKNDKLKSFPTKKHSANKSEQEL